MKALYTLLFTCAILWTGCTSADKKPTGASAPDSTLEAPSDHTRQAEVDTLRDEYKPSPDSNPH
jgi:hypothetical protein